MTPPTRLNERAIAKSLTHWDYETPDAPNGAIREAQKDVRQRSLHLIDIENLLGDPLCPDLDLIRKTFDAYGRATKWHPEDQVLIAANRWLYSQLLFPLRNWKCRLFAASGPDGADLRLLQEAEQENLVRQFDRLVIGSGDGIFRSVLRLAKDLDVQSLVICRTGSLSRRLKEASDMAVALEIDTERYDATVIAPKPNATWLLPTPSDMELGQTQRSIAANAA